MDPFLNPRSLYVEKEIQEVIVLSIPWYFFVRLHGFNDCIIHTLLQLVALTNVAISYLIHLISCCECLSMDVV